MTNTSTAVDLVHSMRLIMSGQVEYPATPGGQSTADIRRYVALLNREADMREALGLTGLNRDMHHDLRSYASAWQTILNRRTARSA